MRVVIWISAEFTFIFCRMFTFWVHFILLLSIIYLFQFCQFILLSSVLLVLKNKAFYNLIIIMTFPCIISIYCTVECYCMLLIKFKTQSCFSCIFQATMSLSVRIYSFRWETVDWLLNSFYLGGRSTFIEQSINKYHQNYSFIIHAAWYAAV